MVYNRWIDSKELFAGIEKERETGKILRDLTMAGPCYQASKQFPGFIERVYSCGKKDVGVFAGGEFRIDHDKTDKLFSG